MRQVFTSEYFHHLGNVILGWARAMSSLIRFIRYLKAFSLNSSLSSTWTMAEMEVELPRATEMGWWVAGLLQVYQPGCCYQLDVLPSPTYFILQTIGPILPSITT